MWGTALSTLLYQMPYPQAPGVLRIVRGYRHTEAMAYQSPHEYAGDGRSRASAARQVLHMSRLQTERASFVNAIKALEVASMRTQRVLAVVPLPLHEEDAVAMATDALPVS